MAYIDTVLALNPTVHYPCDEASGTVCTDVSGNGNHATYNGTFALQARKIVRNSSFESEFGAVDLGVNKTGSGTGIITCPALNLDGKSYTVAGWGRFRAFSNTFFQCWAFNHISHTVGATNFDMQTDHRNVGGLVGPAFAVRPYSRHFFVYRYNLATTTMSMWCDGVLIASGSIGAASSTVGNTVFGGSLGSGNWKQVMQHLSVWVGTAISDADIVALWEAGRTRPGIFPDHVDFDEPEYTVNAEAPVTEFDEAFHTTCTFTIRDAVGASGGRIAEQRGAFNERYGYRWVEAKPEPQQRLHTRIRLANGTLHGGVMLLAGSHFAPGFGSAHSFIHVGVESNTLFIKQYIFGTLTTLATTPFAYVANEWLQLRAEVDSFTREIRAKVWKDADPEPVGWMLNIATMHQKFQYGDGLMGILNYVGGPNTMDIDYINAEYNSGPPQPDTPTLTVDVSCAVTQITGSAFSGGVFDHSTLTIRRVSDQVVVDTVVSGDTDWTYNPGDLPYDEPLEASVVYTSTDPADSDPSNWVPFTVTEALSLGAFSVAPTAEAYAEPTNLTWTEPPVTGVPGIDDIFEYHGEIDRGEGIGYVPLFVGLGTRNYSIDLSPFVGRQISIRVSAVLGECGFAQAVTTFEVVAVPTVLYNQINCPDVTVANEILEGEVVAFSDIACPDTMELTSEDDC